MKPCRVIRVALSALAPIALALTAQAAPSFQEVFSGGESPTRGQVGGPALMFASGLEEPVSVLFSDGDSPAVAATPVTLDLVRGLALVRIPQGAATGSLKVTANGVDSPLYYFRLEGGTFAQGTDVLTGEVTSEGNGVAGATVILVRETGCDGASLWDYAVTDQAGGYTLHGADGGYFLVVLPPVGSGLAGVGGMVTLGPGPVTQDFPLIAGTLVTGRVVDASSPLTGVAGARVQADGDGFDSVLTDANGDFSLRLVPGAYELRVTPPAASSFAGLEADITVEATSPQAVGDLGLQTGVTISGTVTRAADGSPLSGAQVSAQTTGVGCCADIDRKAAGGDGSYSLVVPPGATYRVQARFDDASGLYDVTDEDYVVGGSNQTKNFVAQEAAIISGTVLDRPGGAPLGDVDVQASLSMANGPSAAYARTCLDGAYRLRVAPDPEGYFVTAGASQDSDRTRVTWDQTQNGTFFPCEGLRVTAATAGVTTSGIDFRLPQAVSISGSISSQSGSCTDDVMAQVMVDDGTDHACGLGMNDYQAPAGSYGISGLPPSTVVGSLRACVHQYGFDPQCWNLKSPPAFDPIAIAPGGTQANTDFCLVNCQQSTWYRDSDGDGFGNPNDTQSACEAPGGYIASSGDCNDQDSSINPNAAEVVGDGVDQDCDGGDRCRADADGDSFGTAATVNSADLDCLDAGESTNSADCNDGDVSVHPGATELPGDGVDQDCDNQELCYADTDGDTFGAAATVASMDVDCSDAGESQSSTDCNDTDPAVNPGAVEVCNGIDDDCDITVDESCQAPCADGDTDGFVVCTGNCALTQGKQCGECDDANAAVHPGAAEVCDGADNDCDAGVDEGGDALLCDDGNGCTTDTCGGGGGCAHTPVLDGTSCSDGSACTQTDTCQSGTCTGSNPVVCTASDQCHDAGTCNPANGQCSDPAKADGAGCNDASACTQTDTCQSGTCTGSNPVVCTASDQCHDAGTCNPANGQCSDPAKADGAGCNDASACTQTDTCQSGTCTGSNPVVCTASDQCHDAGTCNPANGQCSDPAKADGAGCNDASACTQTDTCQSGTCTGSNPVVCTASDQCHDAGTCNPANGQCSDPAKADGAGCNDASACTQTDTCQSGTCTGSNPVVCTASDQCHDAGTCNPASGQCSNPAKANGTACNDTNACTQTDTCQSGTCTGSNPVVCTASDQCHDAGTCNPANGQCSNPAKANGTACNDTNACTQTDTCQSGTCTGSNPVVCTASDQCHVAGTCDPGSGQCSNPTAPNGTVCSDADACTRTDTCEAGSCAGSNPFPDCVSDAMPVAPGDSTLFHADSTIPTFTWTTGSHLLFRLEWSSTESFSAGTVVTSGGWRDASSYTPSSRVWVKILKLGLSNGTIHWRVSVKDGRTIAASPPVDMTLAAAQAADVTAPEPGGTYSAAAAAPLFAWSTSHNDGFRIICSASETFSAPKYIPGGSYAIAAGTFTPSAKQWKGVYNAVAKTSPGGIVYYAVEARDALGRTTRSAARTLYLNP